MTDNELRAALAKLVQTSKMPVFASFLVDKDHKWSDPAEVARVQYEVERIRPGAGRYVSMLDFSPSSFGVNPNRDFTPKRFRQEATAS